MTAPTPYSAMQPVAARSAFLRALRGSGAVAAWLMAVFVAACVSDRLPERAADAVACHPAAHRIPVTPAQAYCLDLWTQWGGFGLRGSERVAYLEGSPICRAVDRSTGAEYLDDPGTHAPRATFVGLVA